MYVVFDVFLLVRLGQAVLLPGVVAAKRRAFGLRDSCGRSEALGVWDFGACTPASWMLHNRPLNSVLRVGGWSASIPSGLSSSMITNCQYRFDGFFEVYDSMVIWGMWDHNVLGPYSPVTSPWSLASRA